MDNEKFYTVKELAKILKISPTTIYRSPLKYHMLRVGGAWRASGESLKKFENQSIVKFERLIATMGNGDHSPQNQSGVTRTGMVYRSQTALELDVMLAPGRRKPKNFTKSD